jgi:WW domain-containing oxidoreductase
LGARGIQACVADPGAVRTNIYDNSPKLGKGFIKYMIDNCYAPPEDGAQAVIYAATVDWSKDKKKKDLLPHQDLR